MKYKKLVRDNIPEIIKENGEKPIIRKLSKIDYRTELRKKVLEEAKELQKAKNKGELIEELADIQEVLLALYDAEEIKCSEVADIGRKKRKIRGGFKKQLFLEGVT